MSVELCSRDLRGALDVVRELNEDGRDTIVPAGALERIGELVGADDVGCLWGVSATHRILGAATGQPGHLMRAPGFGQVIRRHPGCVGYRTGQVPVGSPVALSDLASARGLLRIPFYVDLYRPRGVADELLCMVPVGGSHIGLLSLYRTRLGFSRRDKALVGLLGPHVAQVLGRRAAQGMPWTSLLSKLTPRERQVAGWVSRGATDREIARTLAVSPRTVHKHLENMYRKLDLTHRTGLVAALAGLPRTEQE
jgi:DNA-binding CsgD family transcriptional regulator